MAVNIDTVYQRVLAIANKEQRGYVTPQEFNLFANQAQMNIFEQYFYDYNLYNRVPGNQTEYADMIPLLEEKISIFKKRHQPVVIEGSYGEGTLPNDIYRLGTVIRYNLTNVEDTSAAEIERVTEEDLIYLQRSPLATPNKFRPVYIRKDATTIKIYPYAGTRVGDQSKTASVYFDLVVAANGLSNSSVTVTLPNSNNSSGFNNLTYVESGQTVTGAGINAGTTVSSISGTTLTLSQATTSSAQNSGNVTLTFASDDVKCNYVRKPVDVSWAYTEVNGTALYNSGSSVNFELHAAEETNLVNKILQLAGISIEDQSLYQISSSEDIKKVQQEKQ